jgi:hypothetical protein
MLQVVECLPTKGVVLGSIPSTGGEGNNKNLESVNLKWKHQSELR